MTFSGLNMDMRTWKAHRGLCTVVVEDNSREGIRSSGNVSWSQVSGNIRSKDNRADQYRKTLNKLLFPVLQIQLVCQQGTAGGETTRKRTAHLTPILSNLIHIHPSMSEWHSVRAWLTCSFGALPGRERLRTVMHRWGSEWCSRGRITQEGEWGVLEGDGEKISAQTHWWNCQVSAT